MSNILKNKLIGVYNELTAATENISNSKIEIAEALRFNGITNVNDDDTFQRYAELIRRLKAANAMIFEFSIPETAATTYKRTVVLPMYFKTSGNNGASLNSIAKELIAKDASTVSFLPVDNEELESDFEKEIQKHTIKDVYNNDIMDGQYTITLEDVNRFLSPEESEEFLNAASNLGISLTAVGEDGSFTPSTEAMYSYTIDWGDGTEECIYDESKTYEENKAAIFHTYEKGGVYDVTINGTYKKIYTQGDDESSFVEDGQFIKDSDGVNIINSNNYAMANYLIEVIAWGNTLLTDMNSAFRNCQKLASIPMYDTTNSFSDVTDFAYAFRKCYSLKSLPFNSNTNKGLFSDCKKVTSFSYTFGSCTGLTEPIPEKLIDGCESVTNLSYMFQNCSNMSGSIPNGMFKGLAQLTKASGVFDGNTKMNGTIADDLFADSPKITNIDRLFYGCSQLTGTITRNVIGSLSQLTSARQAFYNCKGITGITSDAFYAITSDGINFRNAFYNCGITEIPNGLIESLTGKNLSLEMMFANCTNLQTISSTSLANLKVSNARGMFGNCSALTSALPVSNPDWETYDGIKRWYGCFANTNLSDIETVCLELGGDGERKFSQGKVGAIVLDGDTYSFVDPKDYVYDASHKPIGIVYADVYLDPEKCNATLTNGQGNVVPDNTEISTHKIFATVFNDNVLKWVDEQTDAVDIPTIANTTNVDVGYNRYVWTDENNVSLSATRYNGEAYSKAINEWRVANNMATYTEETGYIATDTDVYLAIDYVNTYSNNGMKSQICFLPDAADLWDQFVMRGLIGKGINKVIAGGNGYSSSNCYPLRENTAYLSSAEYSSTIAWSCYTNLSTLGTYGKWSSYYVRPSFAITA